MSQDEDRAAQTVELAGIEQATADAEAEAREDVQHVPVTIHTIARGAFVVDTPGNWGYMDTGVFATGHWTWDGDRKQRDVTIPYERIDFYEYDFDAEGAEDAQPEG